MYDEDYGDREMARADYAKLGGADAAACVSCSAPCANACPFGVPIPELTRRTHRRLVD